MKWVLFPVAALIAVIVVIAIVGSMLPREHKASRTLTTKRSPAEVWPVLMQAMQSSSVPVDILENQPPTRLVTRVTEKEKNFGGTWTTTLGANTVTITEDGWVANPIFRFVSRFVMGHHATMDGILTSVANQLNEPVALSGE
ncbi:MAG TPA: hypothetical protein VFA59_08375 [Vicinamibacterales bacterium]|nr:hypothetical protein [Vicinamibacterales bacterium]